jgi:uncharacterized cupredoxin-like copper-binding protein
VIRVQLRNRDAVAHDWEVPGVPGAHVAAGPNRLGETAFRAPAPGRYQIICTIPGHKEASMVGLLVVE